MSFGFGFGIPKTAIASAILAAFTPRALFTAGVTGIWGDPSDINLTWRRNLLTYSEQFDNGVWSKTNVTVTANAAVAPDGTTTADLIYPTTSGTGRYVNQNTAGQIVGSSFTTRIGIKAAGIGFAYVYNVQGNSLMYVNLTTGATSNVGSNISNLTSSIDANGWVIVSFTSTINSGGTATYYVGPCDASGSTQVTASGTNGIYIWGAQLEQGSTATPYQRITDGIQDYLQYQAQPVLYQDAAGTVPVTAVEQPVGLMLDKSKGLALGPELVTNGSFSAGTTGWTFNGGASFSVDRAKFTNGGDAIQVLIWAAPKFYSATFEIVEALTGTLTVFFGGAPVATYAAGSVGVKKINSQRAAFNNNLQFTVAAGGNGAIDNISVRELPGNHAFNSSGNSANFPVLSARYNLLTKTEQFDDAVWTKQGSPVITPDTTVAPDGSLTADTLAISPSNYVYQSINITAGVTYTLSCWVKVASGVNQFKLNTFGSGNNFTSDVKTATTNWQQFSFTFTSIASGATSLYAPIVDGLTGGNFYIWGADLRVVNDALNQPAYQRVNTATDYDTVGFKPYLKFNGVNQWLQTNSIDFTYGDKMFVCAGVRKLSDAAVGIVAELSAVFYGNNGTFALAAPAGSPAGYEFSSRGTLNGIINTGGSAPTTNVVSGIGNISGDQSILRINGTQAAISTSYQGTGNYGNYPLYIGARAGTSLWFNGRLYGMVIAGKQASDAEITATETFINQKTGAY